MLVVFGLIAAFILILIFSRPDMRGCRWRADRTRDADGRRFWRCAACGAETFTDGKPPDLCLRG